MLLFKKINKKTKTYFNNLFFLKKRGGCFRGFLIFNFLNIKWRRKSAICEFIFKMN